MLSHTAWLLYIRDPQMAKLEELDPVLFSRRNDEIDSLSRDCYQFALALADDRSRTAMIQILQVLTILMYWERQNGQSNPYLAQLASEVFRELSEEGRVSDIQKEHLKTVYTSAQRCYWFVCWSKVVGHVLILDRLSCPDSGGKMCLWNDHRMITADGYSSTLDTLSVLAKRSKDCRVIIPPLISTPSYRISINWRQTFQLTWHGHRKPRYAMN